jgi:hypothetical protein
MRYQTNTVHIAIASLLMLVSVSAYSQEDSIATDRPDFVESSDTVGTGRWQIETGLSRERDSQPGITDRTDTTPTLFRFGVSPHWELRLETDGKVNNHHEEFGATTTTNGFADIALGTKVQLQAADATAGVAGIAVLLHVDVDSGSAAFRGKGLRPSARAVWEKDLPADTSLGVMWGAVYDQNEDRRFVSGILAATYGKQFTARLHGFIEVAGQQLAHQRDGGCIVTVDTGFSYLLGNDTQVDVGVFKGFNDNSPDLSYGIGFSIRI